MRIEHFLAQLQGVRPNGKDEWIALCPGHPDKNPSLSITKGKDERILLHCFAGCTVERIIEAVGLRVADLFPDDTSWRPRTSRARRESARRRRETVVTEAIRAAMREAQKTLGDLYRETVAKLEAGGWERIMDSDPTTERLAALAHRLSYWEAILDRCLEGEFSAFVAAAEEVAKFASLQG